ncbi:MAG TPA: efflux RND transporter periplasmic adaptor subunit [Verrucomicrobiota bacterium]|nr:efflux RND transporter periplasmic adaptor subunit [Verrucomicrobiota bacterium]HNU49588.1 efflux RND transporter periplasmic adaptor subunit [Verrucomicrobiota bacterium]
MKTGTLGGLCAVAVLMAAGCGRRAPEAPVAAELPSAAVRVQKVSAQSVPVMEEVVGTVRSKLRASLEAKVSGRIERMQVVLGQAVKAGDPLVELDSREIRARLDQAEALRRQADRDLKRFQSLLEQQAVTQAEYDAVEARQRVAQAAVAEAETQMAHAVVRAPFDGVVTRKLADLGDLAGPGRALMELEDPGALQLEADVPEASLSRVAMGARLAVRVASVADGLTGTVREIAPRADPNSRTSRVVLDLPAAPGVRPGQFGRVSVPLADARMVRVPSGAVVVRGQMEMVFVASEGKAQLRLIKTGRRLGGEWEVVSGLSEAEDVVVEGAAGLRDGQPLAVRGTD